MGPQHLAVDEMEGNPGQLLEVSLRPRLGHLGDVDLAHRADWDQRLPGIAVKGVQVEVQEGVVHVQQGQLPVEDLAV
jgi:hypothetical protein